MVPVTFLKKTENFEEHIIAIRKDALHKSLKSRFFSATTHKILGHLKISVAPQPTKKEAHFLPSFPSRLHLHCRVAASYNEVVTVMPNPRTSSPPQCSMAILARWKPCNFLLSTVLLAHFLAPFFFWRVLAFKCVFLLVGWLVRWLLGKRPSLGEVGGFHGPTTNQQFPHLDALFTHRPKAQDVHTCQGFFNAAGLQKGLSSTR